MAKRFALMLAMVAVGALAGQLSGHVTAVLDGPVYAPLVTALLAVGLYGSTHGIDLSQLRTDLKTVVLAVTVGVLCKAALITAVMVAAFQNPAYLVLGVAVAQIDPLSVSALGESSRLSPRGRSLLLAWASFDDPVTTLITIYVAALALPLRHGGTGGHLDLGGAAAFTADLAGNLAVAAVAVGLFLLVRRFAPRWEFGAGCVLLAGVLAVGVWQLWVLAVALAGLVVRPVLPGRPDAVQRLLDRCVNGAFLVASALLGAVLSLGVSPLPGLVLGVTAFAAHALVSLPLTRAQSGDRGALALAQQNGITAIILALLLEPAFGGTVAVVAPAILVINLLYLGGNAMLGLRSRWPAPDPARADRPLLTAADGRPAESHGG
ncbi:hypothetical protein [Actinomadura opuntiae]|uniref:hypothetical protein n=1 Tax=Actinomadura sp. OS1-43 TaxID=604315 RepID=UPI00255B35C6|nr:hypothetical protein [Actinomadura sp. OS1-43]MDL4813640.1 hypothetical protein [Actinomadura sp. OS1-43]